MPFLQKEKEQRKAYFSFNSTSPGNKQGLWSPLTSRSIMTLQTLRRPALLVRVWHWGCLKSRFNFFPHRDRVMHWRLKTLCDFMLSELAVNQERVCPRAAPLTWYYKVKITCIIMHVWVALFCMAWILRTFWNRKKNVKSNFWQAE